MTPHDWQLFWRTLGLCGVVLALLTGIVVATDEAYSTWPMRVARLCAFSPLVAVLALGSALELAKRRGELRALEALGASPWGASWGALCASWAFGGLAALTLLTSWADVSSLFPAPPVTSGWLLEGDAFLEPRQGLLVARDGMVRFVDKRVVDAPFSTPGGLEALSAVLPQVLVLPAWMVAPLKKRTRAWGLGLTASLTLLAFHAAALGRLSLLLLPLVALPIGAQLAVALERGRSQVSLFSAMLGGRGRSH